MFICRKKIWLAKIAATFGQKIFGYSKASSNKSDVFSLVLDDWHT